MGKISKRISAIRTNSGQNRTEIITNTLIKANSRASQKESLNTNRNLFSTRRSQKENTVRRKKTKGKGTIRLILWSTEKNNDGLFCYFWGTYPSPDGFDDY